MDAEPTQTAALLVNRRGAGRGPGGGRVPSDAGTAPRRYGGPQRTPLVYTSRSSPLHILD